jgi:hypothetical protein
MKSTRKEVERYQLETFRNVCTEFPAGEIIDSEEPDFLIKINDGVLGVELTELYHESSRSARPMQAVEKLTDSIVEEACSIHRTAGGPVLNVRVDFELSSKRVGKAQRSQIAGKLAALVLKTPVDIGGYAELENDYEDLDTFPRK